MCVDVCVCVCVCVCVHAYVQGTCTGVVCEQYNMMLIYEVLCMYFC